jgi:hypothetical protein
MGIDFLIMGLWFLSMEPITKTLIFFEGLSVFCANDPVEKNKAANQNRRTDFNLISVIFKSLKKALA